VFADDARAPRRRERSIGATRTGRLAIRAIPLTFPMGFGVRHVQ
jgi:hypothetical protein